MMKFIEKKDFYHAYKIASLGITENDFKILGIEALTNSEFDMAKRVFYSLKVLPQA